jgi:hypothetical protein
MVDDHMVLNSKCPKHVGSFGYDNGFLFLRRKEMERCSHEGYLIKVAVMALAGEVARELSPIRSWSNNNYDLKLAEKGKGTGVACLGSDVT